MFRDVRVAADPCEQLLFFFVGPHALAVLFGLVLFAFLGLGDRDGDKPWAA